LTNNRKIQVTEDGSHTFFMNGMQVTYHSKHGAIQESKHIFIQAGLNYFIDENARSVTEAINIFEVGFGTGLNALLSLNAAINCNIKINYTTIELFPLLPEEFVQLNYAALINKELQESFIAMHECEWDKVVELDSLFSFKKIKIDLHEFQTQQQFHVIYLMRSIQWHNQVYGQKLFLKRCMVCFSKTEFLKLIAAKELCEERCKTQVLKLKN